MKGHRKHTKLNRAEGGKFHRVEFGIIGAPCSLIQNLSKNFAQALNPVFHLAYVDAQHGKSDDPKNDFSIDCLDKISHHQIDVANIEKVSFRDVFNGESAVLVNGNHFETDRQILIINKEKEESLKRKLDRINQVDLIILDTGVASAFPFLADNLVNFKDIPVFKIEDISSIVKKISSIIENSTRNIQGLVFVGGKSLRMGEDKCEIVYHEKKQMNHMAELIAPYCVQTFLAANENQSIDSNFDVFKDMFIDLGPFGGLLTAFQKNPNSAILTVPCDAPLIDDDVIKHLYQKRNIHKVATCYYNPETNFPEPLICIWEPRAYPILLRYLSLGYSCPRKVLINSDIELLELEDPEKLFNVNTPEDKKKAIELLK